MTYYAAHNTRADLNNGNHGFLNTWEVSRFPTKSERDAFVARMDNKKAKAVTRDEANRIWRGTYLSVGEAIPRGGLFGDNRFGDSHFWNEDHYADEYA